ncbi:rCG32698 [Rattus norvegicus]|uniref:RCG32698 n=1 Tax=Rattus norvegicus TaxID=10116 RepID=A6HDD4_RAT|nr:rCG32698 [Rattus norvegicus]
MIDTSFVTPRTLLLSPDPIEASTDWQRIFCCSDVRVMNPFSICQAQRLQQS